MVPNKGRGENIRTNNWTERGVLRLTEPVVDGSLPSGDFHRWKPLRSRWILVAPRRIAAPSQARSMDLAVERRRKSKNTQSRIVSSGGGNFSLVACSGEQGIDRRAPPPSLDFIPYR